MQENVVAPTELDNLLGENLSIVWDKILSNCVHGRKFEMTICLFPFVLKGSGSARIVADKEQIICSLMLAI